MSEHVTIDVVVCTYNNAALLERTLAALAAQRWAAPVDWRVVVVDNNCTDRTPEVVAARARDFPVPLERVAEPVQGLNAARLRGVRHGRGAWIAFVDDDCLLAPDWIDAAARFASAHPRCGAFGGAVLLAWEAPPPAYALDHRYAFAETDLGPQAHRRDWLAGAGMVLRRGALEATGWLERQFLEDRIGTRLVSGGDVELGLRIAAQAEVWYVPQCRLHHVIPARRTRRAYLRRLVFGLGASAHGVELLTWAGTPAQWRRHARRRLVQLTAPALRRVAGDLRHRRPSLDPPLTLAFAAGWAAQWLRTGGTALRARLGALRPPAG